VSGFVPTSIAGCVGWWDAADTSTITGSPRVTSWADKSASARTATGIGSPATGSVTKNGRNVIDFNGGDGFSLASAYTIGGSGNPGTVFVVSSKDALSNQSMVLGSTTDTDAYFGPAFSWSTGAPLTADAVGGTNLATGNYGVLMYSHNGVSSPRVGLNDAWGTLGTSSQARAFNRFGLYPGNSYFNFVGGICEIIFYNTQLSAPNVTTVVDYLTTKWGTP
jgi:hypothetical protein